MHLGYTKKPVMHQIHPPDSGFMAPIPASDKPHSCVTELTGRKETGGRYFTTVSGSSATTVTTERMINGTER